MVETAPSIFSVDLALSALILPAGKGLRTLSPTSGEDCRGCVKIFPCLFGGPGYNGSRRKSLQEHTSPPCLLDISIPFMGRNCPACCRLPSFPGCSCGRLQFLTRRFSGWQVYALAKIGLPPCRLWIISGHFRNRKSPQTGRKLPCCSNNYVT